MRRICVAAVLAVMAPAGTQAAEPKTKPAEQSKVEPVDADFLEFLGSLDTEDEDWREFLESREIKAASGKPVERKPPPKPPEVKQEEQVKKP
jgi:hypothetical protein